MSTATYALPNPTPARWKTHAVAMLIFAATFVAFLPALQGQFLNWDDDALFLENPHYRGLGAAQLHWMFTRAKLGHYHPLTWITLGADYCLWGMKPFGYHLTNLLFHAANAVLVFFFSREMLRLRGQTPDGSLFGATCAAMLFGVHPLRVESVAWITERRDVVSLFFLLLCVRSYLRYGLGANRKWIAYGLAHLWLLCSLLSKAWAITIPGLLLILDVYPLQRFRLNRADIVSPRTAMILFEKTPSILLAAAAAWIAFRAQIAAGMMTIAEHSIFQRLVQACYGLIFYLQKTLLPTGLGPVYELPANLGATKFVVSVAGVLAVSLLAFLFRRRVPALPAAWLIYIILLSPVLGLTQTGPQLVADRYSYVTCLPWVILVGAGFASAWRQGHRAAGVVSSALIVLTLGILTWRQTHHWRDSRALWTHSLQLAPNSWNALNNMGLVEAGAGDIQSALLYFERAVDARPDNPQLWANRALASARLNRHDEALRFYLEALQRDPKDLALLAEIAHGLSREGEFNAALPAYRHVLEQDPGNSSVSLAYAIALKKAGRIEEAETELKRLISVLENRLKQAENPDEGHRFERATGQLIELLEDQGKDSQALEYRAKLRP